MGIIKRTFCIWSNKQTHSRTSSSRLPVKFPLQEKESLLLTRVPEPLESVLIKSASRTPRPTEELTVSFYLPHPASKKTSVVSSCLRRQLTSPQLMVRTSSSYLEAEASMPVSSLTKVLSFLEEPTVKTQLKVSTVLPPDARLSTKRDAGLPSGEPSLRSVTDSQVNSPWMRLLTHLLATVQSAKTMVWFQSLSQKFSLMAPTQSRSAPRSPREFSAPS